MLETEATLFVAAVDSLYFGEIFDTLDRELRKSNPPQAVVLAELRVRFVKMRNLVAQRLDLEQQETDVTLDQPDSMPAREVSDGDHH